MVPIILNTHPLHLNCNLPLQITEVYPVKILYFIKSLFSDPINDHIQALIRIEYYVSCSMRQIELSRPFPDSRLAMHYWNSFKIMYLTQDPLMQLVAMTFQPWKRDLHCLASHHFHRRHILQYTVIHKRLSKARVFSS